jgi:hypothetical protein
MIDGVMAPMTGRAAKDANGKIPDGEGKTEATLIIPAVMTLHPSFVLSRTDKSTSGNFVVFHQFPFFIKHLFSFAQGDVCHTCCQIRCNSGVSSREKL